MSVAKDEEPEKLFQEIVEAIDRALKASLEAMEAKQIRDAELGVQLDAEEIKKKIHKDLGLLIERLLEL